MTLTMFLLFIDLWLSLCFLVWGISHYHFLSVFLTKFSQFSTGRICLFFTAPREDFFWFLYHFPKGHFFITAKMGNGKKFYILSAALLPNNWEILCWIVYRHAMYCSCTLACTVPWPIATDTDRVELLQTHNREGKKSG